MTDSWHHDPEAWYEAPESADHPKIIGSGHGCIPFIVAPVILLMLYDLFMMIGLLLTGGGE